MEFTLDSLNAYVEQIKMGFKHWQFGTKSQLAFLEDLYLLVNDGIPANRAVEMMGQVTTGISREVAEALTHKIAQGQPLADGMEEWFSMNVVEIIRVGEAGGALAQTIKSAINMLSQQGLAIGAFVTAVTYPLMVITIACFVIIYLNNSVFTQFKLIKPISQWPDAGKRLVNTAHMIESWWWLAVVGIIALALVTRKIMTSMTGEVRDMLDTVPPFSIYRRLVAARLLETLGLLVSNGVVFKSAIKVMQYQANPYLLSHLIKMEHLLSMGKTNIADVLATGLVNEHELMRLHVMAEVKGFEHGLIRMGIRGTDQATDTLKLLSRILGGALLALGGLMIIMIVQGIYQTGMAMGQQ